ncbi:MAG TPA: DEAD/DEAH box helicase, partial [Pyrodictium sp.]|nr:DEAD/DEAH box helicase [Pyrodictium sp.]
MTRVSNCPSDEEVYNLLRPYVAKWFRQRYGSFTLPQRCAIPLIKKGYNVLVSSPTGTGKTLAVFLGVIDELFKLAEEGRLENQIYAVYVSPLRALNN